MLLSLFFGKFIKKFF